MWGTTMASTSSPRRPRRRPRCLQPPRPSKLPDEGDDDGVDELAETASEAATMSAATATSIASTSAVASASASACSSGGPIHGPVPPATVPTVPGEPVAPPSDKPEAEASEPMADEPETADGLEMTDGPKMADEPEDGEETSDDGVLVTDKMVVEAQPAAEKPLTGVELVKASLKAMGFLDDTMIEAVVSKHGEDVDACATDLAAASEWEALLDDLAEMGFENRELNKTLMLKNNGNIKRTVKDLVEA